jgi:uncharacterized membrane protein
LAGDVSSELNAVSRDGSTAFGTSRSTGASTARTFRVVGDGVAQPIANPAGVASGCVAVALNLTGTIGVGNCGQSPFRFAATTSSLLDLAPATGGTAYAISADGTTVVGAGLSPQFEAFRWTATGVTMLGKLQVNPNAESYAVAVNRDGRVIAGVDDSLNSRKVAWRWTAELGMVQLPALSGWDYYLATDVSSDGGVIAGWAAIGQAERAVRWVGAGAPGYMGSATSSSPLATNADGSITVLLSDGRYVLWDSTGQRDIATLLAAGPDFAGWTITNVADISDDGGTIVGSGTHAGVTDGWIAHVP